MNIEFVYVSNRWLLVGLEGTTIVCSSIMTVIVIATPYATDSPLLVPEGLECIDCVSLIVIETIPLFIRECEVVKVKVVWQACQVY